LDRNEIEKKRCNERHWERVRRRREHLSLGGLCAAALLGQFLEPTRRRRRMRRREMRRRGESETFDRTGYSPRRE